MACFLIDAMASLGAIQTFDLLLDQDEANVHDRIRELRSRVEIEIRTMWAGFARFSAEELGRKPEPRFALYYPPMLSALGASPPTSTLSARLPIATA